MNTVVDMLLNVVTGQCRLVGIIADTRYSDVTAAAEVGFQCEKGCGNSKRFAKVQNFWHV